MGKKKNKSTKSDVQNRSENHKKQKSEKPKKTDAEILHGIDPKIYDKECDFFRQKGWELIPSRIDRIEDTAKTILGSSAILSGIYFAALKISPIDKLHIVSLLKKILLLSPLFCWFFSFLFSFLTIQRRCICLNLDVGAEKIREILLQESTRKYRLLVTASLFLIISIGFLIYNLYILFF